MDDELGQARSEGIKKLELKLNFLKFLLGTVAISILSIVINWQIQQKRLEFEIQSKESDFVAQFLERGLDKELEKRRDFAEYFVRLSPSADSRERWQNYLTFVRDLIIKANEAEKLVEEKNRELALAAAKVSEAQAEAEKARAELRKLTMAAEKSGDKRAVLENYRKEAEKASAEAEKVRTKLETLRTELVLQRKEVASIRSKPLNVEVHLPITVDNVAVRSKAGEKGYWDWTVFIQGDEDVLDRIKYVEYFLHPTFPDPVRIVSDRGTGPHAFPLSTSGWGTFTIKIKVFFKDGGVQKLTHHLSFAESKRPETRVPGR